MSNNELSTPRPGRGRRLAAMFSVLATTLGTVLITTVSPASAATLTLPLFAKSASITMAGQSMTVWGYSGTGAAITKPSGPTLSVPQGSHVVLELHNQLTETTSLVIRGQSMPTDRAGVAPGDMKSYEFDATQPGTYIYEAGPIANSQHQVAMGLYGTLIVTPTSGSSYGSDAEAVVLVSEIDPALNNFAAGPAAFDMRNFAPKYTLINGAVYSATNGAGADLTTAAPNSKLLLRYVNAGVTYHSMSVLGANQQIVGDDGHALGQPYSVVAQTVGPGQTFDALVKVPNRPGTKLAVFDANLQLRNRNRRPAAAGATVSYGGAMVFVTIAGAGAPTDTVGPVSSNLVATGTTIAATISDATTGNHDVIAAEYFIDTAGAVGTGVAMSGPFGSPTVAVTATFAPPGLSAGNHTIYVRGLEGANWGPLVSVVYTNDNQGPASTGLSLAPNPTNGSVNVALHATGSDVATGGSKVTAAEYTIDGGAATPITVVAPAVTVSLDATIAAATVNALADAVPHTVRIRAQDQAGNWGTVALITLTIDKTGPVTSNVVASPNPNGGNLGINSSTPAVRVTATTADTASNVIRAEGFIDTNPDLNPSSLPVPPAYGTGFLFVPVDGSWNSASESISVDIPLLTISSLAAGPHTIYVHGKDAAGNWGPVSTVVLTIDKRQPTINSIVRADPSPTLATSVAFTVTFSESVTGVTSGNFTLVTSAGVAGATITSVTGIGATRTVTVGTAGGSGTLGLNLTSGTGIKNALGNSLLATGLPMVGQVYDVQTLPLYFSTFGNTNPPGSGGTADDADIYLWNGTAFGRSIDASAIPYTLPTSANVDGFDRVDANHFYMSFNAGVSVPGIAGTVQDEDVVYYNAGAWSLFFDGSVHGVGGTDLDAISIVGGTLYFSTDTNFSVPGVGGTADDADVYRWNGGSSYSRIVDASSVGLDAAADVDGLVFVDATHFSVSFNATTTTVPGLGAVQDEDVVSYSSSSWSVYFDGTNKGLTNDSLDVDAFDIP